MGALGRGLVQIMPTRVEEGTKRVLIRLMLTYSSCAMLIILVLAKRLG